MRRHLRLLQLLVLVLSATPAWALGPRAGLYVSRMDPSDRAARDFARPGWGGGVDVSWPVDGTGGLLAVIGGLEFSSLLSTVTEFRDGLTGLRVEQHTDQYYGRFFVGGELGPHGRGLLEPYANLAVGLVVYGISTKVVVPDDFNRENSINQLLSDQHEAAFGWSAGTGLHLNLGRWGVDGGVRFLKQYGVPQQLGDGAVTIEPAYIQGRLGVTFAIPR
jgi:hypothetical protein